jgi:hypothetical protein
VPPAQCRMIEFLCGVCDPAARNTDQMEEACL